MGTPEKPNRGVQGLLEELGPGLITGAADDDPSGISTYSVAGASFWIRDALDSTFIFSFNGRYSVDVRSTRHGDGLRAGERHSNSIPSLGVVDLCVRSSR